MRVPTKNLPFLGRPEDLSLGAFWQVNNDHYDMIGVRYDESMKRWTSLRPRTASDIFKAEDTVIYGTPVYAMAAGEVYHCWRNHPDNPDPVGTPHPGRVGCVGDRNGDCTIHRSGNHIAVLTDDGKKMLYAHLQPGSVPPHLCPHNDEFVANANNKVNATLSQAKGWTTKAVPEAFIDEGQRPRVEVGDFIGCVGHSGASGVPHIHVHMVDAATGAKEAIGFRNAWIQDRPAATNISDDDWEVLNGIPGFPKHVILPMPQGVYKIRQMRNLRFADAYQNGKDDFAMVTRADQNNGTQRWRWTPLGAGDFTIRQESSGQFVDAYQNSNDFGMVTRPRQNNDTQRWTLRPKNGNIYTIQQESNQRYVDAHENSGKDHRMVTRMEQRHDSQRWLIAPELSGEYTIRQASRGRFMDAYQTEENDFTMVTRSAQNNDSQRWILTPLGNNRYTIQQKSSNRFVDAYETSDMDFRMVTRCAQYNDSQQWIIIPLGGNLCTICQASTGRFADAHESSVKDFMLVTRPIQHNDTQRWQISR